MTLVGLPLDGVIRSAARTATWSAAASKSWGRPAPSARWAGLYSGVRNPTAWPFSVRAMTSMAELSPRISAPLSPVPGRCRAGEELT